ncbi:membrane integrity-associated transporter subunit PqiC [Pseudomonas sp. I2]|uniref:membrane integrity-associated transporter subunit PqiC n=1 Tax=Pseudomonas sp. I2 TaxID=1338438 RepID=UPI0034D57E61
MHKLAKQLLAAGLVATLQGCSSAPIHYHTLVPAQPAERPAGVDIAIQQVTLPPQVDRSQLVIRQGDSGLVILETEWWGANLVDEFRSALQDQLGMPTGAAGRATLRVEVQRFDSIPGQHALLDVNWRLGYGTPHSQLSCHSTLQSRADNSISGLVAAHQDNLRRFARMVAQASAAGTTRCPAPAL